MSNKEIAQTEIPKSIPEQISDVMISKLRETALYSEGILTAIKSAELTKKESIKKALTTAPANETTKASN